MENNQLNLLDLPPYVKSETSYRAAEAIKPHVARLQSMVLEFIRNNGPCTDEQIQEGLGLGGSTQRPRRIELLRFGLIEKIDDEGRTRSGRHATRWVIR